MAWGLLMNRYIFPGATASTPLFWYICELEKAGFEVESVENLGPHYSLTLNQWYKNFMRDESDIKEKYPEAIRRLWKLFLSWSTLASKRGSATVYQIVAHKGTRKMDAFNRAKMMHTVGPIDGIDELKWHAKDQYGALIDEQALWEKGPSGCPAKFVPHEESKIKGLGEKSEEGQMVDHTAVAKRKGMLDKDHPASIHPKSLKH